MKPIKKIATIWHGLIGEKNGFSLEERIFHSVCLIVMAGTALNVPFNYLIGLPVLGFVMLSIWAVICGVYYLSRFRRRFRRAFTIFQVVNNLALIINYYYNSGLSGPSYIICLLSLILSVVIVPRRQYWLWLPLNIGITLCLLLTEWMQPGLITNSYRHTNDRFMDFSYTYVIVALLALFVLIAIRNAYHEERRRAANETAQLAASNETKNKLLSILAHDLKDPLASIQGFLELLADYPIDESERIQIEKQLLTRTQNASQMLANVLTWSKSQMDGVQVKIRELPLAQTLKGTLQLSKNIAAEKGIEMHCRIPEEICVHADADMLQLVARNLLMNAVKFTYPGGKVSLTAETVEKRCILRFSDNGAGIPAEKQKTLFSLSDNPTYGTGKEKGAGLGLVLCRNFIELQGGSIWYDSVPEQGSNFYIGLPDCSLPKAIEKIQLGKFTN